MLRYPKLEFIQYTQLMCFMVFFRSPQLLWLTRPFSQLVMAAFVLTLPVSVQAQTPASGNSNQAQPTNPTNPNILRPTVQESSVLSLQGGQRLMSEAESAISAQDYTLAGKKLQDSRQVFNQLSNYYQELTSSFLGIDNQASANLRKKALEAAQKRDQATYQLALVYRAQNQPSLAVPLLIEIIRSQQPTRDLGQKAYQQLLEMGFVDVPYQGFKSGQSAPPSSGASNQAAPQQPAPQQQPAPK